MGGTRSILYVSPLAPFSFSFGFWSITCSCTVVTHPHMCSPCMGFPPVCPLPQWETPVRHSLWFRLCDSTCSSLYTAVPLPGSLPYPSMRTPIVYAFVTLAHQCACSDDTARACPPEDVPPHEVSAHMLSCTHAVLHPCCLMSGRAHMPVLSCTHTCAVYHALACARQSCTPLSTSHTNVPAAMTPPKRVPPNTCPS